MKARAKHIQNQKCALALMRDPVGSFQHLFCVASCSQHQGMEIIQKSKQKV